MAIDRDAIAALALVAFCLIFSWIYGSYFSQIATYMDSRVVNVYDTLLSYVVMNLPIILLSEAGMLIVWVFLLEKSVEESLPQSIPAGIAAWLFYQFIDYWEPPTCVTVNGEILRGTVGWSGSSDVVMAYFFQDILRVSPTATWDLWFFSVGNALHFCTYILGPMIMLGLVVAFGASTGIVKGFGGETAVEELRAEGEGEV